MAERLGDLADTISIGALALSPDVEAQLLECVIWIREIRLRLLEALGFRGGEVS